jgi:hypothetical protein
VHGVAAHALHQLEPIHDGHVDVGDDDVELGLRELAQPVDAVVGLGDAQAT